MRAKATFETLRRGKEQIVVTEIPYMVNKAAMIEKTAALINEKKIEGISDMRDESDRDGLRIVYDLKRDAMPNVVLNNLYKYTHCSLLRREQRGPGEGPPDDAEPEGADSLLRRAPARGGYPPDRI